MEKEMEEALERERVELFNRTKKTKKINIKKVLIVLLLVMIIMGIFIYVNCNNNDKNDVNKIIENEENIATNNLSLIDFNNKENVKIDGEIKENISDMFLKDKQFDGMYLTKISLKSQNGIVTFLATIENKSGSIFNEKNIKIVFLDKNQNEIGIMRGYVPELKMGEKSNIDFSTSFDYTNAYDFKIEF